MSRYTVTTKENAAQFWTICTSNDLAIAVAACRGTRKEGFYLSVSIYDHKERRGVTRGDVRRVGL